MLFCGKTGFGVIFAVLLQFLRFCCKFRSFGAVYAVLSQNMFCHKICFVAKYVLSQNMFCRDSCVEKNWTKNCIYVEKKWQIWGITWGMCNTQCIWCFGVCILNLGEWVLVFGGCIWYLRVVFRIWGLYLVVRGCIWYLGGLFLVLGGFSTCRWVWLTLPNFKI